MLQEATRRERFDHELLRRYHEDGDLRAREELAERCVPLVNSIARRYRDRGQEMDDVRQAGMLGLVKAIDRFDPTAGHRFITFAAPTIQGEIRRHFRDRTWAVHVPRAVQELGARVKSAGRQVQEQIGVEPTPDDLAEALGVPVEDVRDAQAANRNYRSLSLDQPTGEDRTLADGRGVVDHGYEQVEACSVTDQALLALDERERLVVQWRYEDELLQREIAERIGVSQMQVSRILKQAEERMREHLGTHGVERLAA